MSLTLNVKDFRALSLQAAVFSLSGVEVHVSVVPYAQNEGMYHVIHNKPGVFTRKLILNNYFGNISKSEVQMNWATTVF